MATVCDACGVKFTKDSNAGHATLAVTPARLSFKMIQSLVSIGKPIEHYEHVTHDLCLKCTVKTLTHLGLPIDICQLPELPELPSDTPQEAPLAGALTADDLRQLGLALNEADPASKG